MATEFQVSQVTPFCTYAVGAVLPFVEVQVPGSHGARDHGLLEAALYRPQTGYYAGLVEQAGALWESLSQNHPFIDGNKRTAFAATYTFLAINAMRLTADATETYDFVAALYESNQFNFDKIVPWLRGHVTQESAL